MMKHLNYCLIPLKKLFSDHVTKNCIIDAEKGTWPEELWSEVIENGLNLILVPEELGGVGGNWMNAGILFKASGDTKHQSR